MFNNKLLAPVSFPYGSKLLIVFLVLFQSLSDDQWRLRENKRVGSKPIYQGNVNETQNDPGTKTAFGNKWQRNVGREEEILWCLSVPFGEFFFSEMEITSGQSFSLLYFIVGLNPESCNYQPHPPSKAADRRRASWQLSTESVQLPDKREYFPAGSNHRLVFVDLHFNVIIVTFWLFLEAVASV